MRLLIITQKVDKADPILGFFHTWIVEFSRHYEQVTVICLEKGEMNLPDNVRVLSLGKEEGRSKLTYLTRFYTYIWQERDRYDAVFVHMNPEYVTLGSPVWRPLGKRVSLWYVHRQVNVRLRLAALLADIIFTSVPESFRLTSGKVRYVGHGIDTEKFKDVPPARYDPLVISHVGRITSIKHIEVIIQALALVRRHIPLARLRLVGEPVTEGDDAYKRELVALVERLGVKESVNVVGIEDNAQAYAQASITINAAPNGGMDKTALESLAAGRPVFVANTAFGKILGPYWSLFSYPFGDAEALAHRIQAYLELPEQERGLMLKQLEEKVRVEYDVRVLIERIAREISHAVA